MGRVIVYIATSLDGYVAGKDDDLLWLEAYGSPDEDYGYAAFMAGVGTAIMGARTYAQSLAHPERMLAGVRNIVLSAAEMEVPSGIEVEFYAGDLGKLVERIRKEDERDIYVVGGGQAVSSFLRAGLVDELIHFIAPVLIGEGVSLYPNIDAKVPLRLAEAVPYATGMVKLRYTAEEV